MKTRTTENKLDGFANKPKKEKSKLVKDKQMLSLSYTYFKIAVGLEAEKHKIIMSHTVSNHQYAVGTNKRIGSTKTKFSQNSHIKVLFSCYTYLPNTLSKTYKKIC